VALKTKIAVRSDFCAGYCTTLIVCSVTQRLFCVTLFAIVTGFSTLRDMDLNEAGTSPYNNSDSMPLHFIGTTEIETHLSLLRILQHFAAYTHQTKTAMTYLLRLLIRHQPLPD
jgi:hypothetical protein